jgi:hypothetical protein
MYAAYQASIATATKEVKEFREVFTHPRTREVLDHATQSRKRNPMGISPWQPRDDPSWANLDDDKLESKP